MKTCLNCILLILTGLTCRAQESSVTLRLPATKEQHQPHFAGVTVFDARFDTLTYGKGGDGIRPFVVIRAAGKPKEDIAQYLIGKPGSPSLKDTLYVRLKSFHVPYGNPYSLYFSADAFIRQNGGFRKIAAVGGDFRILIPRNGGVAATVAKVLNLLSATAVESYQKQAYADQRVYSLKELSANVFSDWANFPVMNEAPPRSNGFYFSAKKLLADDCYPTGFRLNMNADSAYQLSFDGMGKKAAYNPYRIFALNYNGVRYIRVMDDLFLPLRSVNSKLVFHVPAAMPDMYAMTYAGLVPYSGSPAVGSNANVLDALAELFVSSAYEYKIAGDNRSTRKKILDAGRERTSARECFLDPDTGDIIY